MMHAMCLNLESFVSCMYVFSFAMFCHVHISESDRIPNSRARLNIKTVFSGLGISIIKMSWSSDNMMTSSNGNIFRVTGHLCGEFTGQLPTQRPVTWSFDVFFDLRLNKRLSKQSWGWWFETLSRPLLRHRNGLVFIMGIPALLRRQLFHETAPHS